MKILITGSNGLLGQKLVRLLLDEEIDFVATSKGANRINYLPKSFDYQSMDITDETEVNNIMDSYQPDTVIHTAAMTNVDQCEQNPDQCQLLNVTATKYLVQACERHSSFLIHLSTDFIFDGEAGPYVEEDQPNPISVYGHSKLEAEKLVKASRCEWAIVRTVLVYGITPGMSRSNIILWVKENLEKGIPLNIVVDQWRTPTLAEDLATGCLLIAKIKANGVFHISGAEMLTPYDMAIQTANFFNLDASLITKVDSTTFTQPARRPPKTGFVLDKAKKELGYKAHTFEEGIYILDKQIKHFS